MKRVLVIVAAATLLLGAGALSVPTVARYYAQSRIDAALKRIRVQTTSVVNRGEVSVELSSRSVTVRDLSIDAPGDGSVIRIAKMTIVSPSTEGDLLRADRIVVEDVTVKSAGETITAPRVEIETYSGPERGLTATPGVGRNARNQAVLIGRISFAKAVAPLILFDGDRTNIRRTVRNAVVLGVENGVVRSASLTEIAIAAPYIPPEQTPATSSLAVSAGPATYERLNLPVLWRFYAGDGLGDREPFLKLGSIRNVRAVATLRPGGAFEARADEMRVEDVELRPLADPVTTFDPIAARLSSGKAPTPQQVRDQLLFAVDVSRAVAFDRIAIEGARVEVGREGAPHRLAELRLGEIGPYADGRVEQIKAFGLTLRRDDARLAVSQVEASKIDASALAAFAERVGRDEQLMTTAFTAEEVVKIAPRLLRVDAKGFDLAGTIGELKLDSLRVDVNAPIDAVPQKIAFSMNGLDAKPADGTRLDRFLEPAELDRLQGSLAFALSLDPSEKSLTLERFDYDFKNLGEVKASGGLAAVDPVIAVLAGADLVDKISAIELGTLKISARDAGAVGIVLEHAAAAANVSVQIYREQIARDVQETVSRLFGPPAENSAEAAADFIRDPRGIELIISPRNASQPLLDLIRAFDLGPAGIAQVIDVGILYRR